MNLEGKRLLILGGASVHCKIVEAAKRLGVYTIVADYLTDSPAKKIADESLLISILDVDAIVAWCEKNPVDGVINYCNDPVQKAHQEICQRLGLPCYGNSVEQIAPLTNKTQFKQLCIESGISIVPSYSATDVEIGSPTYPVLVKPSDSRGSRGQSICYTKEEALKAIEFAKSESFTGNVIIEKYMRNFDDIQLLYLVINGEPTLVKVEDRYLGKKSDNLDRLCITTICPSVHEPEFRVNVDEKIRRMIKKMGLKNAPVFLQGFWDNGDILLYDPGIRFPGDEFDYAYTFATGICLPEAFVKYALTGSMDADLYAAVDRCRVTKSIAMILPCIRAGKIVQIKGIDEIGNHPGVMRTTYCYVQGDTVGVHNDVKQRFAEIVVVCSTFKELKEVTDWLFDTLVVLDENGEDMLISRFNTNGFIKYY